MESYGQARLGLLEQGYEERTPGVFTKGRVNMHLASIFTYPARAERAEEHRLLVAAGLGGVPRDLGAAGALIADQYGAPEYVSLEPDASELTPERAAKLRETYGIE